MNREIIIRKANITDVKSIAKINLDTWKTTYSNIISHDYLNTLSYKKSEVVWEEILNNIIKTSCLYVAQEQNSNIVGFAWAGLERCSETKGVGELHAIYVLKRYQRKGIGKALFSSIIENYYSKNIKSIIVWILKKNKYRSFYESLQGKCCKEKKERIGEKDYNLIAYCWDNMDLLKSILGKSNDNL